MIHVRVAPELKEKIEEEAKANGRSVNAEIVLCLEKHLRSKEPPAPLTRNKIKERGEESEIIHIYRSLTKDEKFIVHAMLNGLIDERFR